MEIIVKTITGKKYTFLFSNTDTILDLKHKIFAKTQINTNFQKIMQKSTQFTNDIKLIDIDINLPLLLITLKKNKNKSKLEINQEIINEICVMGFDKYQVKKCLEASYYNKELAINYLINGIPDLKANKKEYLVSKTQMRMLQQFGASEGIDDLRRIYQLNPENLKEIMENFKKTNEELFNLFSSNPRLLSKILKNKSEKMKSEDEFVDDYMLSDEDNKIVEFLKEFGFEENKCIEAYLICDKNTELTVNYLLDNKINI